MGVIIMTKLNANKLLQKGIKQVIAAGIEPGNINPEIKVNTRAKKRFGLCTRKRNGLYDYVIEINHQLLNVDELSAMNTMVHEILHTCEGCMNHGRLWMSYANKMNRMYGYNITKTSSYEKMGLEKPKPKYLIKCKSEKCTVEIPRYKKSKSITQINRYACPKCRGKLKVVAC